MTPAMQKLVDRFAALPGVGRKSAVRLAYHVLNMPQSELDEFVSALTDVKRSVGLCKSCQTLSETELCPICADPTRDRTVICVTEDFRSADTIESLHEYKGLYHILHGVISPMDGIGPEKLKIRELLPRLDGVKEVIVATNPSGEGDVTAMYIAKLLKPMDIKVTRIAYGLPVGATLEYADGNTLWRAFEGRREV